MDFELVPVADRVIIRPDEPEKEVGGVLVPDSVHKRPQTGEIIAVGSGTPDYQMTCEVGQKCYFKSYPWPEVEMPDGEKLLVIRERELFGVLKPTK